AFEEAGVPHYANEADALRGFTHLVRYRAARDALMATPPSLPEGFAPDLDHARGVVATAIAEGRDWLDPVEITKLLDAYAIPIAPAILARDADEAAAAAQPLLDRYGSLVVKLLSPDIVHKSD